MQRDGAALTAPVARAWVACARCGAVQAPAPRPVLNCRVCRSELERRTGRSLDAALALSAATLLLLAPANLAPFLSASVLGAVRESHLVSGPAELWREGWPALAALVALTVVIAPILRFGLLTGALGGLRLGRHDRWIGPVFRWADQLQPWAMADVALLALWIAYTRLSATVPTRLGVGGACFIAVGLLSLFTRATLNKPEIWRRIRAQRPWRDGRDGFGCAACGYLVPARAAGRRCPRCAARLWPRKAESAGRAAALTLAGLVLYVPANLFPMATIPIGLEPSSYTVLEGVKDLFEAHLFGLGLLVFSASFAVPLLKLSGLTWFLVAVAGRARGGLRAKARLYGVVEEIGRWSMVDPLVIACFIPVMQFNAKLYGRAGPAATAFSAVVVLTMVATRVFDPRSLWDAARRRA
ncbi:paraquat-inducible protein A [Phenylobacterium sp.]|jgi:paraquat-inducible protein A|uniref:paraquat-inducible protein A n=1 Tax=Phenylobacterium sp. TaxID=1871053 RepID=UPI002E2F6D18|nr:paraquat-inducible protein A [Phenylobacterium sp.]HEX3364179.1 paraquat-inducible protein A [Phenylobacterium sp.]